MGLRPLIALKKRDSKAKRKLFATTKHSHVDPRISLDMPLIQPRYPSPILCKDRFKMLQEMKQDCQLEVAPQLK
jgi:hypothetical protein